jgi:hypothetical protein
MKIKIGSTYKHYKNSNNLYKVIALAKDSETLQDTVVYEALYPNPLSRVWVRPYHEWVEQVINKDGESVQRFMSV